MSIAGASNDDNKLASHDPPSRVQGLESWYRRFGFGGRGITVEV